MKKLMLAACACAAGVAGIVFAEDAEPFQASLVPTVALHERTQFIEGMTLCVWGENPQRGFGLGFVNGCTGDSSGLSLGLLVNYADAYYGAQIGCANIAKEAMSGLQLGFGNFAKRLSGVQLGLLNYAESSGQALQVGVVNVLPENAAWFANLPDEVAPGMIFLNWHF